MPRLSRLTIPGELHFVVQRSLAGRRLFVDDIDRTAYLASLRDAAAARQVAIHAFVLLDDEVQWLATPASADALGRVAQGVGRQFVAGSNHRHGLRGPAWEGRFRSAVVDGDALAPDLIVMVEQEAVVRGLSIGASAWPWSSAGHHLGLGAWAWLSDHPSLWALGNTPFEREAAHARRLAQAPDARLRTAVNRAAGRGWAYGASSFIQRLTDAALPRSPKPLPVGRPRSN